MSQSTNASSQAVPDADGNATSHAKSTTQTQPRTGTFTLLLFASASTYCNNTESLTLPAPTTLASLVHDLEQRFPGIGTKVLKSCQMVVNLEYVDVDILEVMEGKVRDDGTRVGEEVKIQNGDEVAVVPPVSSG